MLVVQQSSLLKASSFQDSLRYELSSWLEDSRRGSTVHLGNGDDWYDGTSGSDKVYGGSGDDMIDGNAADDILKGGSGEDTLTGSKGSDSLIGGAGDDELIAGTGHDYVYGGSGSDNIELDNQDHGHDHVIYKDVNDSLPGEGHDEVAFFDITRDKIDLRHIDANTLTPGNDAFHWIGSAAFDGTAGALRYDPHTDLLQGDVNGDSVADFEVLFDPFNHIKLDVTNIYL